MPCSNSFPLCFALTALSNPLAKAGATKPVAFAFGQTCPNVISNSHIVTAWLLAAAAAAIANILLQEEWPEDEGACAQIRADFSADPAVGDRRQELVFIGQVRQMSCSGRRMG